MINIKRKKILGVLGLALAAVLFTVGCSLTATTELSGEATKGPISGGTVTVYALNTDGTRGAEIASAITGADGSYTVDLGEYTGAAAVVITGGSYVDEATGTTVTLGAGDELVTLLSSTSDGMSVAVTALTTIAAANAVENASGGLATAIDAANLAIAAAFGIPDLDVSGVIPSDLTQSATGDSASAIAYGAVQSGLSQFAETSGMLPSDVLDMISNMALEFADGAFDGAYVDQTGYVALLETPVSTLTGLATAIDAFLLSPEGTNSGVVWGDLNITIPTVASP